LYVVLLNFLAVG